MTFYFSITAVCVICMYYIQHKVKRVKQSETEMFQIVKHKYLYYFPFLPLFLISALRYGIGTDYFYTYYPTFFRIRNGYELSHSFEFGFYWLNKIIASFSDDVTWIIAICALIFFVFIAKAVIEQSEDPALSIFLLVGTGLFAFSMNGMRQAVVIAMWFYAIKYIKQKKFIPYLVCMLVSGLFHLSAIITIPLYFLYTKVKCKPRTIIIWIVSSIAFTTIFKRVIIYISRFTKYYDKFVGTSQFEGDFAYSTFCALFGVLIYLLLLYKSQHKKWEYNFLLLSTAIGTVCSILTGEIYVIARIVSFFQYVSFLYLPSTFKAFNKQSRRVVSIVFVIAFMVYIWFMADYLGKGETVPYQSIFSR